VECYISFGWDDLLVDPDRGWNTCNKLLNLAAANSQSESVRLLQSLPEPNDPLWTKSLVCSPQITFSTIFKFLVQRKVYIKKVSHLESLPDIRARKSLQKKGDEVPPEDVCMNTEYTRTLDKAYKFFSGRLCSRC